MVFFFFNDTATTEIYTLSLHDALPIFGRHRLEPERRLGRTVVLAREHQREDRKSTRQNSSHSSISYAVFCLKKKNEIFQMGTRASLRIKATFKNFSLHASSPASLAIAR